MVESALIISYWAKKPGENGAPGTVAPVPGTLRGLARRMGVAGAGSPLDQSPVGVSWDGPTLRVPEGMAGRGGGLAVSVLPQFAQRPEASSASCALQYGHAASVIDSIVPVHRSRAPHPTR